MAESLTELCRFAPKCTRNNSSHIAYFIWDTLNYFKLEKPIEWRAKKDKSGHWIIRLNLPSKN